MANTVFRIYTNRCGKYTFFFVTVSILILNWAKDSLSSNHETAVFISPSSPYCWTGVATEGVYHHHSDEWCYRYKHDVKCFGCPTGYKKTLYKCMQKPDALGCALLVTVKTPLNLAVLTRPLPLQYKVQLQRHSL